MLTHREFSAWIVSDGRPIPEYLHTIDKNASKVSCWIPSEAGKTFSIHWRDAGSRVHSCAFISLDGFLVPGRFLNGYGETSREGVRTGSNTERPFVFMEQPDACEVYPFGQGMTRCRVSAVVGGQVNTDAGTVVLKIRRVSIDGARAANKLQELPEPSSSQSSASSHRIGFGEERPACEQHPQTWHVKPDPSGNRSYVTFIFRYRSREFLLSQGIMPADGALRIPSAVRKACAMKRRVASAPAGNSMLVTSSPTASPQVGNNLERVGFALQNACNPGIRPATNGRTVSVNIAGRHGRYPGEGIIDFNASVDSMNFILSGMGSE